MTIVPLRKYEIVLIAVHMSSYHWNYKKTKGTADPEGCAVPLRYK
jgi:hypothetical protein